MYRMYRRGPLSDFFVVKSHAIISESNFIKFIYFLNVIFG